MSKPKLPDILAPLLSIFSREMTIDPSSEIRAQSESQAWRELYFNLLSLRFSSIPTHDHTRRQLEQKLGAQRRRFTPGETFRLERLEASFRQAAESIDAMCCYAAPIVTRSRGVALIATLERNESNRGRVHYMPSLEALERWNGHALTETPHPPHRFAHRVGLLIRESSMPTGNIQVSPIVTSAALNEALNQLVLEERPSRPGDDCFLRTLARASFSDLLNPIRHHLRRQDGEFDELHRRDNDVAFGYRLREPCRAYVIRSSARISPLGEVVLDVWSARVEEFVPFLHCDY